MTSATPPPPTHNYAPRVGFDDSGSSGLYHTARPSYPREAIRAILEAASGAMSRPLNVLEIGSGTGISTESLLREAGDSQMKIGRYLAVEPSLGMRKGWEQFIAGELLPRLKSEGKLPAEAHVECRDGTFEELALPDGSEGTWDVVVIAQAYHWCPDYDASLRAISSALRPGTGQLALIWNLEDNGTSATWVRDLRNIYEVYEDGTPQYRHGYWKKLFDLPFTASTFEYDTAGQHYARVIPTTTDGVKRRVLSKSYISVRSQEEKQRLQEQVDELFARGDAATGRKWINEREGTFEYPYVTDLWLFRRKE